MHFFKNKRVESYEIVMKRLRGKWRYVNNDLLIFLYNTIITIYISNLVFWRISLNLINLAFFYNLINI
jgi:hypothetical protein